MSHTRILSILAPRIQQFFSWTFDPNALAEPLLKQEEFPTYKQRMIRFWDTIQQNALPQSSYVPPRLDPKVKG